MEEASKQHDAQQGLANSLSQAKTSYDRIKRTRFIVNIVQSGVRSLFGGIGIPFLITIFFVAGATFGLIFLNPDLVLGGTSSSVSGGDCTSIPGAQCVSGNTCPSPSVIDTTGAVCTDQTKPTCCVPSSGNSNINFVYYSQYDPAWKPSGCDIQSNGCAPTSIAMILSSFGVNMKPPDVGTKIGGGCSGPTYTSQWPSILSWIDSLDSQQFIHSQNLVSNGRFLTSVANGYLNNGYIIVANADLYFASWCAPERSGHSFVITQVNTAANTATVYDPTLYFNYCRKYNTKTRTINLTAGGCPSAYGTFLGGKGSNIDLPQNVCSWSGYGVYAIKHK